MGSSKGKSLLKGILLFFVETHPKWFKSRKKIEQILLIYPGIISGLLFAIYPIARLGLHLLENGWASPVFPWILLTAIGFLGGIVAGYAGGGYFHVVYFFASLICIPTVYRIRFSGSVKGIIAMCAALVYSFFAGMIGIAASPLGAGTREAYQRLKEKTVPDSQANEYAQELRRFEKQNLNWLTQNQSLALASQIINQERRYSTYEEKLIGKEAEAMRTKRAAEKDEQERNKVALRAERESRERAVEATRQAESDQRWEAADRAVAEENEVKAMRRRLGNVDDTILWAYLYCSKMESTNDMSKSIDFASIGAFGAWGIRGYKLQVGSERAAQICPQHIS
jgi:hypothetical protein